MLVKTAKVSIVLGTVVLIVMTVLSKTVFGAGMPLPPVVIKVDVKKLLQGSNILDLPIVR